MSMKMLEKSMFPYLEAKYPAYHLTYDKQMGYNWNDSMSIVNFTINAVKDVDERYPGWKSIDIREQKIVALGMQRGEDESLRIKRIEVLDVVPRREKIGMQTPVEVKPVQALCGSDKAQREVNRMERNRFLVFLGGCILVLAVLVRRYRFVFEVRGNVSLKERKEEGFLIEKA